MEAPQGPLQFGMNTDFNDSQMVPSGDGAEIHFALPMTAIRAPYGLNGMTGVLTYAAAVAYIAIKLHVKPLVGPAILPEGSTQQPAAKGTKRLAPEVRDPTHDPHDPTVSIVDVIYTKPLSDPPGDDPMRAMLLAW